MSDRLKSDQFLSVGQSIISQDGRFTLVLQSDGNLVLHAPGGQGVWATHTEHKAVERAYMQSGGNFVLLAPGGAVVWRSDTDHHPESELVVQNDRNLVIYQAGIPIWATHTPLKEISVAVAPFANLLHDGCTDDGGGNPRTQAGTYFRISGQGFAPRATVSIRASSSGNIQLGIISATVNLAGTCFVKCFKVDNPGPGEEIVFTATDESDNGVAVASHGP